MIDKKPFNGLTNAEAERLALLIEECAEVQQVACKILRHGYASHHPKDLNGPDNRELLDMELGDLQAAMALMVRNGDIFPAAIGIYCERKLKRVGQYLHHQEEVK